MTTPNGTTLYLELLEKCLINTIYRDPPIGPGNLTQFDPQKRMEGLDWPSCAYTMVGQKRLNHLRQCAETVIQDDIPGDFVETGVWRGGACILLRGVLKAHGDPPGRRVWLADSFQGLPAPEPTRYPPDRGDQHHRHHQLVVDRATVESNFSRFGLLDDRVVFLEGWFRDTLPQAPMEQIAVLRLDGDMYESTILALEHLYDKVVAGGFVIVDDYGFVPGCAAAVEDFRAERHISTPLEKIDATGVSWRKTVPEQGIATFFNHAHERPEQARAVLKILKECPTSVGQENLQAAGESLIELPQHPMHSCEADRIELAELSKSLGHADAAARQYSQILQRHPDCLAAHEGLARCLLPGPDYRHILHQLHRTFEPQVYLEIGVDSGETLRLAGPDSLAIGVDPCLQPMPDFVAKTALYKINSDQFFTDRVLEREHSARSIDLAFIDGDHSFEQVLRDFYHTERYCHQTSIVLLHDCLPLDPITSSRQQQTTFYTGDCWKILTCLRKYRPDLIVKAIPAPPTGLVVVAGLDPTSTLLPSCENELVEEFVPLTFDDFQRERERYLDTLPNSQSGLETLIAEIQTKRSCPAA